VQFTIERLRTLVVVAGLLLVVALGLFLAHGRLMNPMNWKELPQKLGVNITADSTGFTYDHSSGGHSRYRIHASKAVQYKDNHAILHDVKIELYGDDPTRVDHISGAEFDYDQNAERAKANGAVEITLMRPGVKPAEGGEGRDTKPPVPKKTEKRGAKKANPEPVPTAAEIAERDQIHVKTSGLSFDTKSGLATTAEHVDFSSEQGTGSSMGASYDSKGFLVLDHAVELNTKRDGRTVQIHAQHAEFERQTLLCRMHAATADYRGGHATTGDAKVLFRQDGSAVRLDAINGFNMVTATGDHIAAPSGWMEFDEQNQPTRAHMEGGVKMDSTRVIEDGAGQRRMRATAPTAELYFTPQGQLRHTHLERGVELASEQQSESASGPLRVSRTWKSPITDLDFRDNGHGQPEPKTIHGVQGVVVTGESQRGKAAPEPSRLAADEVTGEFGPNSVLSAMTGIGHASVEQTNAAGTQQTSSGDRLEAQLAPAGGNGVAAAGNGKSASSSSGTAQIQSAVLDGHVVMTQIPAAKPNAPSGAQPSTPLRAWAGHAFYEGAGELLHLTESPRIEDGGLEMTADKMDVSHASGDAFAHGNVKATWFNGNSSAKGQPAIEGSNPANHGDLTLGGKDPAHVVAAEAQLSQPAASGAGAIATFRGHARLWQQANSVAGPVIVLDRQKQTLVATSSDPAEPVKVVLLSAGGPETEPSSGTQSASQPKDESVPRPATDKAKKPSVIRVRGGDLKYSDAEHKAIMRAGALASVIAETPTAISSSNQVELLLLPAGNHAGKDGGQAQVDRLTATDHVVVSSEGRRGTGEQLVYTGENGEYVLTGTAAAPPRMTDSQRGNVTGQALIFHSRDDSVSIEGGGQRTTTETTTQK
jgi:lipopolysaccharide export system protein LptA